MRTIYKYPVKLEDRFKIAMPEGSQVLSVQLQDGSPYMWVLVDPTKECVPHTFYMAGTGHLREELKHAVYVGTFQMADGRLVFHLFDGGELVPF